MVSLTLADVACERNERLLFENLRLKLRGGDILQIKGVNGSGKTSLLKMIAGLAPCYDGEILWNQQPITEIWQVYSQARLYIGHQAGLTPNLTVYENLRYMRDLANKPDQNNIDDALQQLQLQHCQTQWAQYLSAGQQRRASLAQLSLLRASIWILDEPFTTLDQTGIDVITALIKQQAQAWNIVIFSSHQSVSSLVPSKMLQL